MVNGSCRQNRGVKFRRCHLWVLINGKQTISTDYSEHPHECGVRRGVKSSVVVRRGAVVVPRFVAFSVERSPLGIQSADWLEEKKKKKKSLTLQCLDLTGERSFSVE